MGVRECGSAGAGKPTPIPPHTHTPAPLPTSNAPQVWQAALALALLLGLTGCGFYSFSGATIPAEYETIAIVPVENETATPLNNLGGELTDLLNERFVERTRLRLETNENEADVVLSGRLTGYSDEPAAVSGEERATRNEVSLRAEIRYRARERDSLLISDTYTQSETYDLAEGPDEGARSAALVALENIADAVFSDATSDW